jgi:hypothetical protein
MKVRYQQRILRRPVERAFGTGEESLACERKGNHRLAL